MKWRRSRIATSTTTKKRAQIKLLNRFWCSLVVPFGAFLFSHNFERSRLAAIPGAVQYIVFPVFQILKAHGRAKSWLPRILAPPKMCARIYPLTRAPDAHEAVIEMASRNALHTKRCKMDDCRRSFPVTCIFYLYTYNAKTIFTGTVLAERRPTFYVGTKLNARALHFVSLTWNWKATGKRDEEKIGN